MAQRRSERAVPRITGGSTVSDALKTERGPVLPVKDYRKSEELDAITESLGKTFGSVATIYKDHTKKQIEESQLEGKRLAYLKLSEDEIIPMLQRYGGVASTHGHIAFLETMAKIRFDEANTTITEEVLKLGLNPKNTPEIVTAKLEELYAQHQTDAGVDSVVGDLVWKALKETASNDHLLLFNKANQAERYLVLQEDAGNTIADVVRNIFAHSKTTDKDKQTIYLTTQKAPQDIVESLKNAIKYLHPAQGRAFIGESLTTIIEQSYKRLDSIGSTKGTEHPEYEQGVEDLRQTIDLLIATDKIRDPKSGKGLLNEDTVGYLYVSLAGVDRLEQNVSRSYHSSESKAERVEKFIEKALPWWIENQKEYEALTTGKQVEKLKAMFPDTSSEIIFGQVLRWNNMRDETDRLDRVASGEKYKALKGKIENAQDVASIPPLTDFVGMTAGDFENIKKVRLDVIQSMKLSENPQAKVAAEEVLAYWKTARIVELVDKAQDQTKAGKAYTERKPSDEKEFPTRAARIGAVARGEPTKLPPRAKDAYKFDTLPEEFKQIIRREEPIVKAYIRNNMFKADGLKPFQDQNIDTVEEKAGLRTALAIEETAWLKKIEGDPDFYITAKDTENPLDKAKDSLPPDIDPDVLDINPDEIEPEANGIPYNSTEPLFNEEGQYVHRGTLTQNHIIARYISGSMKIDTLNRSGIDPSSFTHLRHEKAVLEYSLNVLTNGGSATGFQTLLGLKEQIGALLGNNVQGRSILWNIQHAEQAASPSQESYAASRRGRGRRSPLPPDATRSELVEAFGLDQFGGIVAGPEGKRFYLKNDPSKPLNTEALYIFLDNLLQSDISMRVVQDPNLWRSDRDSLRRTHASNKDFLRDLLAFRGQRQEYEDSNGMRGTVFGSVPNKDGRLTNPFSILMSNIPESDNNDKPIDLDFMEQNIIPELEKLMALGPAVHKVSLGGKMEGLARRSGQTLPDWEEVRSPGFIRYASTIVDRDVMSPEMRHHAGRVTRWYQGVLQNSEYFDKSHANAVSWILRRQNMEKHRQDNPLWYGNVSPVFGDEGQKQDMMTFALKSLAGLGADDPTPPEITKWVQENIENETLSVDDIERINDIKIVLQKGMKVIDTWPSSSWQASMTEKKNSPLRQFLLYGFTVGKPPEKLGEDRGTFEDYNIRGRDLEAIEKILGNP